eukprot:2273935-Rhodomonas_salina.2
MEPREHMVVCHARYRDNAQWCTIRGTEIAHAVPGVTAREGGAEPSVRHLPTDSLCNTWY